MCLDQICHNFRKIDFIFQVGDAPFLVGKEGRKGMYVIVVDARYMRIGDDNEWKVAQGLYTMREADG